MTGTKLFCPQPCGRRLGNAPGILIWTGALDEFPYELDGNLYISCVVCKKKKRPHWQRFEIVAPERVVEVVVKPETQKDIAA